MSRTRILRESTAVRYSEDRHGEEEMTVRVSISMNAKHRKRALADRFALIQALTLAGELSPHRCDCSHCARDWDCCGKFVAWRTRMTASKGGVYITQTFSRNL